MDVAIDHSVANPLVNEMENHANDGFNTWQQAKAEFENLKASGAMLGAAVEACQLAVARTDEHATKLHQEDLQLLDEVRHAHGDDLRTEEESANMFTGLGTGAGL